MTAKQRLEGLRAAAEQLGAAAEPGLVVVWRGEDGRHWTAPPDRAGARELTAAELEAMTQRGQVISIGRRAQEGGGDA